MKFLGRVLVLASMGCVQAQQYTISTIAGGSDPATHAARNPNMVNPAGIATDGLGNIYFSSPNVVFKIDKSGVITRFAGTFVPGYSGDGGPALNAQLNFPVTYPELEGDPIDFSELVGALATDSSGNVFIADAYNSRVRKIDQNGIIMTVAETKWPQGVGLDQIGNLYVSSAYATIQKISPGGGTQIVAGSQDNCGNGYTGPGICAPEQIAIDGSGNIFVPDGYCRVRKISPDGSVVTVAGAENIPQNGFAFSCGYSEDGGPATSAALAWPFSVAVDATGNLYIADTYNSCIRKVDTAGIITTIAGVCGAWGYSGDGGPATSARLSVPHGIALDAAGNIYIADTGNSAIRILTMLASEESWQHAIAAMKTYNGTDSYNFWQWAWIWQRAPTFPGAPPGFGALGSIDDHPGLMGAIIAAAGGDGTQNVSAENWIQAYRLAAAEAH